jgi:hypothetical protein
MPAKRKFDAAAMLRGISSAAGFVSSGCGGAQQARAADLHGGAAGDADPDVRGL